MKYWQRKEKKDASQFGTKQQRGSGNQDFYPTDSYNDFFAVDTKATGKKSYSLTLQTWNKLCEESAVLDEKDGGMRIPFLSLHLAKTHLVILSATDFQFLTAKKELEAH